jgi:hypothetical protein
MRDVLNGGWFYRSSNFMNAGIEKTTLEEWEGVYVGVRAQPEPPHIPVLFSRLTFFQ